MSQWVTDKHNQWSDSRPIKTENCSLTDLVTTWYQEMLAHLKKQTVTFFRLLILKSLDRIFCHSFLKTLVLALFFWISASSAQFFVLLRWTFGEKQVTKPDYFPALFQLSYCALGLSKLIQRWGREFKRRRSRQTSHQRDCPSKNHIWSFDWNPPQRNFPM